MPTFQMRLSGDNSEDRLIISWLREQPNMSQSVKGLIFADIERRKGRGILHQIHAAVMEVLVVVRAIQQGQIVVVAPPTESGEDHSLIEEGLKELTW